MTLVEGVPGRVVDVEQNGIVRRLVRLGGTPHHREEVVVDERRARVIHELRRNGQQMPLVPSDHGREGVDHIEAGDTVVLERCHRGVSEAEASDQDRKRADVGRREAEPCQLFFRDSEQTRHEIFIAELDLVDEFAGFAVGAATEGQLPHPRLLPVELFESRDHARSSTAGSTAASRGGCAPSRKMLVSGSG